MSITGKNMGERLPVLLERAHKLGVPVQVRPHITRTGVDHIVAAATVTVHADVGTAPPDVDVEGEQESGRLQGTWLQVVGEQDLEFAANLRRHRVIDEDQDVIDQARPVVYSGDHAISAAAVLLFVDVDRDELADAVQTLPAGAVGQEIEQLSVDWRAVTAPNRAHGAVTLALMARSLLHHGEAVDLSGLAFVDPDYADAAEHAFEQLAAAGRHAAGPWLSEDESLGDR